MDWNEDRLCRHRFLFRERRLISALRSAVLCSANKRTNGEDSTAPAAAAPGVTAATPRNARSTSERLRWNQSTNSCSSLHSSSKPRSSRLKYSAGAAAAAAVGADAPAADAGATGGAPAGGAGPDVAVPEAAAGAAPAAPPAAGAAALVAPAASFSTATPHVAARVRLLGGDTTRSCCIRARRCCSKCAQSCKALIRNVAVVRLATSPSAAASAANASARTGSPGRGEGGRSGEEEVGGNEFSTWR